MTFDELVAEVYILTTRPDLTAMTKSAIKAATLKAHKTDFYSKDIFESGVEFSTSEFRQSLDYIGLFSNFRALKYLKRVESQTDEVGAFIDIITPEEVLDSYGCNRSDIAYVAGRVLEIRSAVSFSKCLLGCYVLPIVREDSYTSWVAEQSPFLIIYEAVRVVLATIGQTEESNSYRDLVIEEFTLLKMSALTDVGS